MKPVLIVTLKTMDTHKNITDNITITEVCNMFTVSYQADGEKVDALILPTDMSADESYSRVLIDKVTGEMRVPFTSAFMKDTAILETESPIYRAAAHGNATRLMGLSHYPGMEFSAEEHLVAWANACPSDKLRLFVGGDVCCSNLLESAMNVARRVPDKTIVCTSCNMDATNELFTATIDEGMPPNFWLFIEHPYADKLCFSDFPSCTYTADGDAEGDFAWWPKEYTNCTIHVSTRSKQLIHDSLARDTTDGTIGEIP